MKKRLLFIVACLLMTVASWAQNEDMLSTPLTLEAIEAGEITFNNKADGPVTYRVNGGEAQTIDRMTKDTIAVNAGDKVTFFGDNSCYGDHYNSSFMCISCTTDCYVFGNIMSLISSTAFADAKKLTTADTFKNLFFTNTHIKNHPRNTLELPATTLVSSCYSGMFSGCTGLTEAPALPATTLVSSCYSGMFSGCTGLTEAPALPATNLAWNCYNGMFRDCTGLTKAPELPATTLADNCYGYMFSGCTSLTKAPALPATTLTYHCYRHMFYLCTSLTEAPVLPATTLAERCYGSMFRYCTNLKSITCLATDISAKLCTEYWLEVDSPTGVFYKNPAMTDWPTGISGIPEGWTVKDYDPTGISTATATTAKPAKSYDLRGVKTSGQGRGLRIENGRKVVTR